MQRLFGVLIVLSLSGCLLFEPNEEGVVPAEEGLSVALEKVSEASSPVGIVSAIIAGLGATLGAAFVGKSTAKKGSE